MTRDRPEHLFEHARFVGGELDERFRVLALTLMPLQPAAVSPIDGQADMRIQALFHPVSTLLISLRLPQERQLLQFATDELADMLALAEGAHLLGLDLDAAEPQHGDWGPQFSLRAQSNAPDGRTRRAIVRARRSDIELDLFVRCDAIEVRDAAGNVIAGPNASPPE